LYYWDSNRYHDSDGKIKCTWEIEHDPKFRFDGFENFYSFFFITYRYIYYPNGTKPREIAWRCQKMVEKCCELECCPAVVDIENGYIEAMKESFEKEFGNA
jgi:hypothetical protein